MKIYINNFNLVTWPKAMAEFLANQGHEIFFIDNASTWPPLLEWYDNCPFTVYRLNKNYGNKAPWDLGIVDTSDYYVISDPDYLMDGLPEDWPEKLLDGLRRYNVVCVGLSMEESRVPSHNPAWIEDEFYKYPNGTELCWGESKRLEGGFWNYPTDTSFALHRPGKRSHTVAGIRSDKPYTIHHAPWHIVVDLDSSEDTLQIEMDDEYCYYLEETIKAGKAHTTGTTPRMQKYDMIQKYRIKKGYEI